MSDYNAKNYTKQGGEETVIGGKLTFASGAEVDGLPAATASKTGGVKKAANVAACDATDAAGCVTSINAILTALKAAGIMANS